MPQQITDWKKQLIDLTIITGCDIEKVKEDIKPFKSPLNHIIDFYLATARYPTMAEDQFIYNLLQHPNIKAEEELKTGYVKIYGIDNATGFVKICKEDELTTVGEEIFNLRPGEDGYYNFNKFLWVKYPDNRYDRRLDDIVPYQ